MLEDTELGGIKLPKGSVPSVSILNLHFSEELYPNARKFIPERFQQELKHPFGYVPFRYFQLEIPHIFEIFWNDFDWIVPELETASEWNLLNKKQFWSSPDFFTDLKLKQISKKISNTLLVSLNHRIWPCDLFLGNKVSVDISKISGWISRYLWDIYEIFVRYFPHFLRGICQLWDPFWEVQLRPTDHIVLLSSMQDYLPELDPLFNLNFQLENYLGHFRNTLITSKCP